MTPTWHTASDDELLPWRIKDLGLRLAETDLAPLIEALYAELAARGVQFRPPCYLGDEWCVYYNVPAIALPFYLAHPRLKQLEQKMMLEIEGGTREEAMRLLRHETGHALMYAYRLQRRAQWRKVFGDPEKPYTDSGYRPHPYSKRYVQHLDHWYAQCHPDEDFAETFAVWLTPDAHWRDAYRGWPALAKLEYVDQLMQAIGSTLPPVTTSARPGAAERLERRLATHYARRRKEYAHDAPDFYDGDLRKVFATADGTPTRAAAQLMRQQRRTLVPTVARWTGARKYIINELITALERRCRELDLRVAEHEPPRHELLTYLTVLIMNYVHTGHYKATRR